MAITAPVSDGEVGSAWQRTRPVPRPLEVKTACEFERTNSDRYQVRNSENAKDAALLAMKRVIDVLVAGTALLFLAPLLVGVALAIGLTSPGPVLFCQYRYGYRNRLFRIYKFRTMYTHFGDRTATIQTRLGDPRVTKVGRVLRNTSLDELPQLLNVLKGDMSLVGPRPHVPGMLANGMRYEELVPYYFQRHMMRPGITGLAQVNGYRGDTTKGADALARIDHDLHYIENWSPWMDIKIILKTCQREFVSGNGA